MNINDLKTFVDEVLNNPDRITNIDEIMNKSLDMYNQLSDMFMQATPSERERIIAVLIEIGDSFERRFSELSDKMGMSKEQLMEAMKDPKNYTPEVWSSVQNFQKKVDQEKRAIQKATDKGPKKVTRSRVKQSSPRTFA